MGLLPANSFTRYCIGGALGFGVDAGAVLLLTAARLNPFAARAVSIVVALAVTWVYHRHVTFRPSGRRIAQEIARYYASNALGAVVNYGVYSLWLMAFAPENLLIPLAVASIVALAVNYLMARSFVFRYAQERRHDG